MIEYLDTEIKNQVLQVIKNQKGSQSVTKSHVTSIIRLFDILISASALIVTFPVVFVISIILFFLNGKPIIFKQIRLGKNGEKFQILKFRTMRSDATDILKEDLDLFKKYLENDYKLPANEDPRLVKLGSFLRKTSIDEIPQFFNVLKGDMSIVGPRPIVPEEIERYEGFEKLFLSFKPGITGLWQITGRSDIEYPQRKYLDLLYIENKSIMFDIKIFLKTIKIVLFRRGAH